MSFGEEDFDDVLCLAAVSKNASGLAMIEFGTFDSLLDDKSSHWNARLMLANAKSPSGLCSCMRFAIASCGITLETKEELLFTMLVLGFLRFTPSLPSAGVNKALSSPKTGVFPAALAKCAAIPSLLVSCELLDSFSLSLMLYVARFDLVLPRFAILYRWGGLRGLMREREILTPVEGRTGAVDKGFGFVGVCSDGWGGGVAR